MIVMFVLFLVLALVVFQYLTSLFKIFPKVSKVIELGGYFLLLVSVAWALITNSFGDTQNYITDEKLNILWQFEGDKLRYLEDQDFDKLLEEHNQLVSNWHYLFTGTEYALYQESLAKQISYWLVAGSTIFIAVGRWGEILNKKVNENNNKIPSNRKRRRHMRKLNKKRFPS